ncbi:MAG: hypothetical protein WCO06_07555 [Candidatus Roizmanbacteria bacterium]
MDPNKYLERNKKVIQLSDEYKKTPLNKRVGKAPALLQSATERLNELSKLIETNPSEAIKYIYSPSVYKDAPGILLVNNLLEYETYLEGSITKEILLTDKNFKAYVFIPNFKKSDSDNLVLYVKKDQNPIKGLPVKAKVIATQIKKNLITTHIKQITLESNVLGENSKATYNIKVKVIVIDPYLADGTKVSAIISKPVESFTSEFASYVNKVSHGSINYSIDVKSISTDTYNFYPEKKDGFVYTPQSFTDARLGKSKYHEPDDVDYQKLFDKIGLNVCQKVNAGEMDEIWLFAPGYIGFHETTLYGPLSENSFFYNSAPKTNSECKKIIRIYGFNMERQLSEMAEDMGHAMEATMTKAYNINNLGYFDPKFSSPPTKIIEFPDAMNRFQNYSMVTRINSNGGVSGCGLIHYSLNSIKNYDWSNSTDKVDTYCSPDAGMMYWKDLPIQKAQDCNTYGCSQLGFFDMWFGNLPHYEGVGLDKISNNWWDYYYDPAQLLNTPYNGKTLPFDPLSYYVDIFPTLTPVPIKLESFRKPDLSDSSGKIQIFAGVLSKGDDKKTPSITFFYNDSELLKYNDIKIDPIFSTWSMFSDYNTYIYTINVNSSYDPKKFSMKVSGNDQTYLYRIISNGTVYENKNLLVKPLYAQNFCVFGGEEKEDVADSIYLITCPVTVKLRNEANTTSSETIDQNTHTIVIHAFGTKGGADVKEYPTIQFVVDDYPYWIIKNVQGHHTVGNSSKKYEEFAYTYIDQFTNSNSDKRFIDFISRVKIRYINDYNDLNDSTNDRNVEIGYVEVDGVKYDPKNYLSTGSISNGCTSGFANSNWLNCNGEFDFSSPAPKMR